METLATGFDLLEGPVWDPRGGLLFSDAKAGGVYRLDADGTVATVIPHRRGMGGLALHERGGLVVSGRNIAYKPLDAGETRVLLEGDPGGDPANGNVGFNDITTDAAGRVYAGSLGSSPFGAERKPGALFVIDRDGSVRRLAEGVKLTNGLGFSPDGKRLYHSDSGDQTVYVYDVAADGGVTNRRPFATLAEGIPDGLAVSEDGAVWVAAAYDSAVLVFEPDGTLRRRIAFPLPMVTSLCFGGDDLRTLYVVTGSEGAPTERSGTVYRLRAGVPGLPVSPARVAIA